MRCKPYELRELCVSDCALIHGLGLSDSGSCYADGIVVNWSSLQGLRCDFVIAVEIKDRQSGF